MNDSNTIAISDQMIDVQHKLEMLQTRQEELADIQRTVETATKILCSRELEVRHCLQAAKEAEVSAKKMMDVVVAKESMLSQLNSDINRRLKEMRIDMQHEIKDQMELCERHLFSSMKVSLTEMKKQYN